MASPAINPHNKGVCYYNNCYGSGLHDGGSNTHTYVGKVKLDLRLVRSTLRENKDWGAFIFDKRYKDCLAIHEYDGWETVSYDQYSVFQEWSKLEYGTEPITDTHQQLFAKFSTEWTRLNTEVQDLTYEHFDN